MQQIALPPRSPLAALHERLRTAMSRRWHRPTTELRIDVQHRPEEIETELELLHHRLHTPGDRLFGIASLPAPQPGLVFRHREADGEHYLYVEDVVLQRLAGYTVFNRLIEVDRRTDRHVRAPHSKYAPAYQRRGIATAVYEWGLQAGFCLVSGARQSPGAHALWLALGRRHPLGFVTLRERRLHYLGSEIDAALRDRLETRMILLGRQWTVDRLRALAG